MWPTMLMRAPLHSFSRLSISDLGTESAQTRPVRKASKGESGS